MKELEEVEAKLDFSYQSRRKEKEKHAQVELLKDKRDMLLFELDKIGKAYVHANQEMTMYNQFV